MATEPPSPGQNFCDRYFLSCFLKTSSNVAAAVEAFKKECHIEKRECVCVCEVVCVCVYGGERERERERERKRGKLRNSFFMQLTAVAVPLNSARDSSAKNYLFSPLSFHPLLRNVASKFLVL